jgi:transcriptional regulator with XRE-family HTH domain
MPIDFALEFSNIKRCAESLGQSLNDLARYTGIPKSSLSLWFRGEGFDRRNIFLDLRGLQKHIARSEQLQDRVGRIPIDWGQEDRIRRQFVEMEREAMLPPAWPSEQDFGFIAEMNHDEPFQEIAKRHSLTVSELVAKMGEIQRRLEHATLSIKKDREEQEHLMHLQRQEHEERRQREFEHLGESDPCKV